VPELSVLLSSVPEANLWFTRLSMYFVFRYYADAIDEPLDCEKRLIQRSLRTAELLALTRFHANCGTFTVDEMIDLIHLYSKQIEHSTENVDLLKAE
ncbi:MAG: hypothetical protein Q4B09_10805, partial [Lachnospiraceae bacterium]|nr:hypothetical protein [Lachnospiraceae bacterium]